MTVDEPADIVDAAAKAQTMGDVARLLRELRLREGRRRRGPELAYREIAHRTGWSHVTVFSYFHGSRLAPPDRLGELGRVLGAHPDERAALLTATARISAARRATDHAVRAVGSDTIAPRALPAPARAFTGRTADLARLDEVIAGPDAADTVLISAVAGMGGVGKTALAVYWAHRVADRFPDGQIYVNLRGYDPDEPLTTMDALGVVLGTLGVPSTAMPSAIPERIALYQRLLDARTMLVLLDNASDLEQVQPLLPPKSCMTLVTSRDKLTDLVRFNGARMVTLDVLPEDDALSLLRLLIGRRAVGEIHAVRTLARLCGYLPLALRVAAEHAISRPAMALTDLVCELQDSGPATLDGFENVGDERADVRAVFSWSLRRLPEPESRAFRLFGLAPGTDIDAYGLAALVGASDIAQAENLAHALVRAHLLQADGGGRYSMHDLLRAYAAESVVDLPAEDRREAIGRLLDFSLTAATVAVEAKFPYVRHAGERARPQPVFDALTPEVGAVGAAAAWLATERTNLVRATLHAARHGWSGHAVALALVLRPFLDDRFDRDDLAVLTEALQAAQRLGDACDLADRVEIQSGLAVTNWRLGRLDAAAEHAEEVLALYRRLGMVAGAVRSLAVLGAVRDYQGRFIEAIECLEHGLAIARSAGLRLQEAHQLNNLGYLHGRLERFDASLDLYQQAEVVSQEVDDQLGVAEARLGIAMACLELGRHEEALTSAEAALAIEIDHDRTIQQLRVIDAIASIYARMGQLSDATELIEDALITGRDINNAEVTTQLLSTLGETHLSARDHSRAIACLSEAHDLARQLGDRLQAARAQVGLGDAHELAGDIGRAWENWSNALRAYRAIGHAKAARVSERLARLNAGGLIARA